MANRTFDRLAWTGELQRGLARGVQALAIPHTLLRVLLALSVALLAGYQLRHFITWSPEQLATHGLVIDDAFFYTVLARNFHRFGFLTLDGVIPTNGVQPLWMGIHILLAGLFPQTDGLLLVARASWALYVLFALLTVWYAARGGPRAMLLATLTIGGLLLLNVRFQQMVVKGLEVPLALCLLILTLHAFEQYARRAQAAAERPLWQTAGLGALAALCFLARTDLFWAALLIGGWLLLRPRRSWKEIVTFGAAAALLVLPYVALNALTQGGMMPISGRVKLFYMQSFYPTPAAYLASEEWRGLFSAFAEVIPSPDWLIYLLTYPLIGLGSWLIWREREARPGLTLLTAVILGHVLFMQLVYRELRPYTNYYFAPEALWLGLTLATQVSRRRTPGAAHAQGRRARVARALPALVAAGCLLIAAFAWSRFEPRPVDYWVQRVNLARDIQRVVPADERVAAFWPGALAHFSNRQVIPLDGIIGSQAYFEAYVQPGRELDYLRDHNVRYLAIALYDAPEQILARDEAPGAPTWSTIGPQRLWEQRHRLAVRAAAERPYATSRGGWYLLELTPLD
jgi:hypothetical protein